MAWVHLEDRGWIAIDMSKADKHPELKEYYFGNLTADRVMFSVGRDLALTLTAMHGPLNFFVFPHVAMDGEMLPPEKLEL